MAINVINRLKYKVVESMNAPVDHLLEYITVEIHI